MQRHTIRASLLVFLVLTANASAGCNDDECPSVCDLLLQVFTVRIVDEAGEPVLDLDPVVTIVRTGERLVRNVKFITPGKYSLFTNVDIQRIWNHGREVRMTVTDGVRSATADYVVRNCACRLEDADITGPRTVVLR